MKMRILVLLATFIGVALLSVSKPLAQAPPPSPVVVTKVEEQKIQRPVTLVGGVEPSKRSLVASEIGGLVEKFPVDQGDFVKKGDLLVGLQTRELEISLREAKAAKREAEARFNLARKNFARFQELYEKGVASAQQLQDMESEEGAWSAKLSQLQAQIDKQEYDLARSRIVAPFNGYVIRESTEVGQWIDEGGEVVELINIDTVEVNVALPERYISRVKPGDKVVINFDALPRVTVEGEISSVVPQADREARTFPIEVTIDNEGHVIKSGMVARVSFLVGEPSLAKLVPKDAIVQQGNNNFVYIVNNGTANPIPVTTGIAYNNLVEINGPIETGQLVVIRGNERLRPGQPVEVVNQDGKPEKG
ncbi:MAG TPA: efflux RND transporter periplasmic adaptor subunit [Thermodesulfobacteriota bacterium]|nr:efflux RND transporter periplasmic adaptor subunit [Thermodesulfobacteriota bacterium]